MLFADFTSIKNEKIKKKDFHVTVVTSVNDDIQ